MSRDHEDHITGVLIMSDYVFLISGILRQWRLFASRGGILVSLQIWRPMSVEGDRFVLVESEEHVLKAGLNVINTEIVVSAGDVIGW